MIEVSPLAEVSLTHRADQVDVAAGAGHIVAISGEGQGSLLAPNLEVRATFTVKGAPRDVAISLTAG